MIYGLHFDPFLPSFPLILLFPSSLLDFACRCSVISYNQSPFSSYWDNYRLQTGKKLFL